jgi:hypothetical protein
MYEVYGLDAISANNGWNIAALGITIVFTGLVLLSLAISQLHKVLTLWETKHLFYKQVKEVWQKKRTRRTDDDRFLSEEQTTEVVLPKSLKKSADQFNILVLHLGEPFPLPKLLGLAIKRGLDQPHSTLNNLIQTKLIVPDKLGFFRWNEKVYNCISEPEDE